MPSAGRVVIVCITISAEEEAVQCQEEAKLLWLSLAGSEDVRKLPLFLEMDQITSVGQLEIKIVDELWSPRKEMPEAVT